MPKTNIEWRQNGSNLRDMSIAMTRHTKWNHIKPMLFLISQMMMILGSLFPAISAFQFFRFYYVTFGYRVSYCVPGFITSLFIRWLQNPSFSYLHSMTRMASRAKSITPTGIFNKMNAIFPRFTFRTPFKSTFNLFNIFIIGDSNLASSNLIGTCFSDSHSLTYFLAHSIIPEFKGVCHAY